MDDDILQGPASATTLAHAVLANWEALERHIIAVHGGHVDDTPTLFRCNSGLHTGFLNGILRADDATEDLPELIADTRRLFVAAGVPWRWMVGVTSAPGLADRLEALGVERRWEMPGMAIDLEAIVEPERVAAGVREVLTADDLEAWLSVRRRNLELDDTTTDAWRTAHGRTRLSSTSPLRHFTVWADGKPAANATLFLGAGVAGVYHVDTLAEARGRGFGTAVTLATLHAARAAGARYAVLSASALGEPVYRRLGFIYAGHVSGFVGPAA